MNEEEIFHQALARTSPQERAAYLDQACAGDPALRASIEALLRANVGASGFLDQPAPAPVATVADSPRSESAGECAGTLIGPYKLIQQIGEGGMGTVWMAQQTERVKRLVALKLIKAGMDSKQVLARFEAERQAVALMDHPNIAKVHDAGATPDGRPFFVMELVKGVPITRYCDEHRLTPRQRLELFVPVCAAIQHAHQKGIIHRDIKPSNVLVAMYDDKPVPKVIDFGVAKATGVQLTEATLNTNFGAVVGTLEYMSPEQASFNQLDVDTRSDIYSLGVLLYELLAGSPPFTKKELEKVGMLEMLRVIREQDPSKPSTKLSSSDVLPSLSANRGTEPAKLTRLVRGELDWIVMKALEKDRTRRYETTNGFAADVQRYLADEPVLAGAPSKGYRLRKLVKRNKGPVTAAVLIFVTLVAGIGSTTWAMLVARDAEGRARAEETKALQERDEKEKARVAEQAQRVDVEGRYASQIVDLALADDKGIQDPRTSLLKLAETLARLPASAREARQFLTMRILYHGQLLQSLWPIDPRAGDSFFSIIRGNPPLAVSMGRDHVIRLRDIPTGRVIREVRPVDRTAETWWFNVSDDGTTFMVAASAGGHKLPYTFWDVATGRKVREFANPEDYSWHSWSPDARNLVTRNYFGWPQQNANILGSCVQLWDTHSGRLVGNYPGYDIRHDTGEFTKDGRFVILCAMSGNGGVVISTSDGQVVRHLRGSSGFLTPTGHHLVTQTDKEVLWYRTSDWELGGSARKPPDSSLFTDVSNRPVVFDSWCLCRRQEVDGQLEDLLVRRDGSPPVIADAMVVAYDASRLLTSAGTVYEIDSLRVLPRPVDRKYHAEARRLSPDTRLLWIKSETPDGAQVATLIDFVTGKPVATDPYSLAENTFRVQRCIVVKSMGVESLAAPTLLPTDDVDIDPGILDLWVRVVTCGELNFKGAFVYFDETAWEAKRTELASRAQPLEGFPFPGAAAEDGLHWLRTRADEAKPTNRLPLLDRLVAAEPNSVNYAARANHYSAANNYSAALDDWTRAAALTGSIANLPDSWADDFLRNPDLPQSIYTRVDELFRRNRGVSVHYLQSYRLLLLYRLGKYREVIDSVTRHEVVGPSEATMAMATLASPLMFLNALLKPTDNWSILPEDRLMAAMSHHRLGKTDLALAMMARAKGSRQWPLGDALWREAIKLTGYSPPEGKRKE